MKIEGIASLKLIFKKQKSELWNIKHRSYLIAVTQPQIS
ncbi:hypothetical protein D1AOALGA4SA_7325 [Olavius algarvensis Delta 1 endosymbiont]|nr:hypothetical protein D1AOALGA4SA_7325 [Olavius algarvensis Delta 1 endosymbiont]